MKKRLRKKLFKKYYKSYSKKELYKITQKIINLHKKNKGKVEFISKTRSKSFLFGGGDRNFIVRHRLAGLNFSKIIIDDVI